MVAVLNKRVNQIGAPDSPLSMLREVELVSISIFHSLLCFLSMPKSDGKAVAVSGFRNCCTKGAVACENQLEDGNDLQSLDVALLGLCKSDSRDGCEIRIEAQNRQVLGGGS